MFFLFCFVLLFFSCDTFLFLLNESINKKPHPQFRNFNVTG